MMKQLSFFLVLAGCSWIIDAHPYGAPESACSSMTPNHGLDWQKTVAPYEIILDKTAIQSSESLTIRLGVKSEIGSDQPAFAGFKGFLIMAFDATGVDIEPIGVFNDPASGEMKTLDCPSQTQGQKPKVGMTHTTNDLKKSIEVVWTPPANYIGPVIIQVTFVQERDIFWVRETTRHVDILPLEETTLPPTTTEESATEITTTTTTTEGTTPATTTSEVTTTTEGTTPATTTSEVTTTTEGTTPATTTSEVTTTKATTPTTTAEPGGSPSLVASWALLIILGLFSNLIRGQL